MLLFCYGIVYHSFIACATATATATVAPTMGLLPMPIRPIISTCAGANEVSSELREPQRVSAPRRESESVKKS
jgi:hypothetical protein